MCPQVHDEYVTTDETAGDPGGLEELAPLVEATHGPSVPEEYAVLCSEMCHYMADIVWHSLVREPSTTEHRPPCSLISY